MSARTLPRSRLVAVTLDCADSPLLQILWSALEQGGIDPRAAMRGIEAGMPGGRPALDSFTRHPVPAVRAAAAEALQCRRCAPAALAFTVLGGFSVTRDGRRADDGAWERRVAQRVVRLLLVHRGRAVSEDEIIEAFWPDRPMQSARRSLHVAISRVRRVLDTPGAASAVEASDRVYRLRLRPGDSVDSDEFQTSTLAALRQHGTSRVRALERAASLWRGEPLPEERYSDWALGWRERLIDLHMSVLAALSDACLDQGDLLGAVRRARELVDADPLDENAHRRLMLAYARAGRRGRALRQFLECRRVLLEQIGLEPALETGQLQQRILTGELV
jgi:DNA-binding SARP family transcriptional activator